MVSTNRARPRKSSFRSYFKKNYDMYLLLIPGLVYAIVFKLLPLLGISIAFVDYNMFAGSNPIQAILKSDFVGWKNFIRVFRKADFLQALRNTFIISFMKNRMGSSMRPTFFKTVFTMPVLERIDMKIPETTTHEKKCGR